MLKAIGFHPAEPLFGAPARPVFAADETVVAREGERIQDRCDVDLPAIRLVAQRHARDLHVTNAMCVLFDPPRKIALGDLRMINVELQAHVVEPDGIQNFRSLIVGAKKIIRPVACVQGLDGQGNAEFCRFRACFFKFAMKASVFRLSAFASPAMTWIVDTPSARA